MKASETVGSADGGDEVEEVVPFEGEVRYEGQAPDCLYGWPNCFCRLRGADGRDYF